MWNRSSRGTQGNFFRGLGLETLELHPYLAPVHPGVKGVQGSRGRTLKHRAIQTEGALVAGALEVAPLLLETNAATQVGTFRVERLNLSLVVFSYPDMPEYLFGGTGPTVDLISDHSKQQGRFAQLTGGSHHKLTRGGAMGGSVLCRGAP